MPPIKAKTFNLRPKAEAKSDGKGGFAGLSKKEASVDDEVGRHHISFPTPPIPGIYVLHTTACGIWPIAPSGTTQSWSWVTGWGVT